MLTQDEVKRYAHMRRLKLIDQIWKDYLQDFLLYLLYRKMPKMVFGGGTCLWKVLKGGRFSEDLDCFVSAIPVDLQGYLVKELTLFGVKCNVLKSKKTVNMLFLELGLSFPSHHREVALSIEMLTSSMPKTTEDTTIYPPYPDIPPIEVVIPSKEDMLANKVSAIHQRNRPRDVYDTSLLLKLGAKIDRQLVKKKIPSFKLETFEEKIMEKEGTWDSLGPLTVTKLPAFRDEAGYIVSCFRKAMG